MIYDISNTEIGCQQVLWDFHNLQPDFDLA